MGKQYEVVDFTEASSSGVYDSTLNMLYGGVEQAGGVVRAPLPKAIRYLEEGYGVTLAPCVFVSNTYIFTAQMTSATVLRINRWDKTTLAWKGYISVTIAGAGVKTCRDLFVKNGANAPEILLAFTSATTSEGGVAWCYGILDADWNSGVTFAAGTTSIAARLTFVIKQNATNILIATAAIATSTPTGTLNSGSANSFVLFFLQSTNTAAGPMFVQLDLGTTMPAPVTGIITILDAQRIISGVMLGDIATNLPQATLSQLFYASPGANHPVGVTGVPALFYTRGTTTSRVGRKILTDFTAGFTSETDYMADIPPLGATVQLAQNNFAGLAYCDTTDYFHVELTGNYRAYRFIYAPGQPMERHYGDVTFEYNPNANPATPKWFTGTQVRCGFNAGLLVVARQITGGQQLLVLNVGAQGGYVIARAIDTPNAKMFARLLTARVQERSPEMILLYQRTAGIVDNSGAWTAVGAEGDLSGVSAASQIQFKVVFDFLGHTCISPQIAALGVTYEDDSTVDSHYEASVSKSNVANRIFAYRQMLDWGEDIPTLRIRLYNAGTGGLILDDDSDTPTLGTWEYSTDGTAWNPWNPAMQAVGYYIRYTATSLPDGTTVRALLTLL